MAKPQADGAFLRIDSVVKEFGDFRAVDQVSLDIAKGEIFALLGSSGCGKSTLLRMLAGFETPTSGRIILNGQDLAGKPPYERPVNMMFQSYALFPHMTVADNIAFGLRRDGLPKAEIAQRVEEMLRLVQLTKLAARKPHQLSGGQQQRVALARSLAKRPQLLLLDEPLGALDKKLREATQIELVNIIEQVGVTCVMVTHDQEEAMTMASRIAVMSEGRFLQVGSPADIYETPTTRFVADFIGNVNLTDGRIVVDEADHVQIECADFMHHIGHGITGYLGQQVTVAVRPEKISLSAEQPEGRFNQVPGTVKEMSYFGDTTLYHLELASGARLKVTVENDSRDRSNAPTWGDRVWAHWQPNAQVVLTQ
ncbi:putrescine transport system ATP-binding protein [Sphaerotilus sulfidivorans]|uniref:Spermidine/putrescine import ATP-binding protein PotA n=1 Tax=Sphaerotilus sulfidivorans TaxID=639200 RepID=A0A5C1Q4H0_9BURK|nr:polyamine ABC transporter ATP-binding protein [Sphaerotilus sulfidivorans]NZD46727.1 polyamine ABC transporter ATP-binding protein [Sphaerotilus sulfidivorans]QEN00992.1 polyamine ABC transporter ATP-binding protein [Sphaerotilus sulfidivorans]GIX50930.1 polyamine-transporting ATPase [Sphaerotilus natans]